jgi:hypothetical protein
MTKANAAKSLPAAMVAPFVVAAASLPSVMVAAPPAVCVTVMAVAVPDLNHATIRRRHRGNAQPGGSRYAHNQRSK